MNLGSRNRARAHARVFLRSNQGRYIKILGRNNLSECPHKYLMCSISQGLQCQCVCASARASERGRMCVQAVITSLLVLLLLLLLQKKKHQEGRKGNGGREEEGVDGDEREDGEEERKESRRSEKTLL